MKKYPKKTGGLMVMFKGFLAAEFVLAGAGFFAYKSLFYNKEKRRGWAKDHPKLLECYYATQELPGVPMCYQQRLQDSAEFNIPLKK